MRQKFYEKALPSQGVYCVSGIKNTKITNRFAESISEVFKQIEQLEGGNQNVFVALSSFNGHSRRTENALFSRTFYLDLDVGEGKGYAQKQDALEALEKFVAEWELPPPVRIDSGNGIHAYWIFDADIPIAEWKPYAEKFKNFCREHINIDPVVTADAARIMRCPETFNYKSDPPTVSKVLDEEIYQYDFEAFKEFLGPVEVSPAPSVLAAIPKGLDDDTREIAKLDNFETVFQIIAERSLSGDGCNQIKYVLENSKTLPEPMWWAGLSIARHCVDWEESIQLMSEDHPEYTHEKTLRKANESVGKPKGCEIFELHNPGGCAGCPQKGRITNPLAFGRRLKAAPEGTTEVAVRPAPDTEEVHAFPPYLLPFVRGVNGGVYYMPPPEVDKDGKKHQDPPLEIIKHDLYPIQRIYSRADGACFTMRYVLPKDPMREFLLPIKDIHLTDRLKEVLGRNEVHFHGANLKHIYSYLLKWSEYMANMERAEQMRMQMGFIEDKSAFVIGNIEIHNDGSERRSPASPFVRGIAKLLHPVGEYDVWQRSANALNEEGFELHAFTMLCGFGSPLMSLTTTSGVSVSLTGPSGNGKTGALYGQLSIWGHPKDLSVFDSTENGMIGRYLGLHNLPLGCDEFTNKNAAQISQLLHRISHGKAKIRMQASVNAERELEYSASLIATFTNNMSIYDKLGELKAAPDGEMARIVEFTADLPKPLALNPRRGKEIFDLFNTNYGHAGPRFVKHYYKVGEGHARVLIDHWIKRFIKDFGDYSAYRFYENLIGSVFAGAELAMEAGIIDLNLDNIYVQIVRAMLANKENVKLNNLDYKSLIGEFINRHSNEFLIMNEDRVTSEPRGQKLVGRIEVHNQIQYVSKSEFKKFLAELHVGAREFEVAMEHAGVLASSKKQRLTQGWKSGYEYSPIAVYGFKTEIDKKFLEDEPPKF